MGWTSFNEHLSGASTTIAWEPRRGAIADELGWAKTCDAEYVALARLLGCRVVTLDGRLRRGADRFALIVSVAEFDQSLRPPG